MRANIGAKCLAQPQMRGASGTHGASGSPGAPGPPGAPGKLPIVKLWQPDSVTYEARG